MVGLVRENILVIITDVQTRKIEVYRILLVTLCIFLQVFKPNYNFSALIWKIYSGSKKSTRQSAAVFVLEKRTLETRYPDKTDREAILEQCRKAVAQLTRLKHPQVLTVQVGKRRNFQILKTLI